MSGTKRDGVTVGPGSNAKRHRSDFVDALEEEYGDAQTKNAMLWHRPSVKHLTDNQDDIYFQWLDIDMYEGGPLPRNPHSGRRVPGSDAAPVPIIRLYGVTEQGYSVCLHVHGFTPYFYCSPPPNFDVAHLDTFRNELQNQLRHTAHGINRNDLKRTLVQSVQLVSGYQNLYGFRGDAKSSFLMIHVSMPTLVSTARGILERGFRFGDYSTYAYQCFESNVPFLLRFMIDNEINGCNWIKLPKNCYSIRNKQTTGGKGEWDSKSSCQIEADIVFDSLVSLSTEGEWQKIAPFRILSFDIECCGRKGHFPEAEHDPVIQIANVITCQGAKQSIIRNVFVLGGCSPIVGAQVHTFSDEKSLLEEWSRFVRESDPDIITGYNIQNFDMPYLLNRANTLGVKNFPLLGRIVGSRATMRDTTFQSSAYGKTENVETNIEGRVMFDMIQYVRRNHKLSSYSLNSVSAEFLGQQKEDVHHSIISDLHHGNDADRHRLAVYCLKDAFLPQKLMDKLMVMINHIEMARVTGVPLNFLLARGQQIKVISMLYRKCRPKRLLIPTMKRQANDGSADASYEGATVIEPKKAYYSEPIATLDFASLYPSIMMAHNLCYSTLVASEDINKLQSEQYQRSPSNDVFVTKHVKKGILPEILEELLTARKRAKKDMAAATDPMVKAVQNGRQLALKISANSVYGFTGATVGQLPCLAISSSTTSYGRQMIQQTKEAVERIFTIKNGYPADATVVYGDTDSVMIKFGTNDVATAMEYGRIGAEEVSKLFPDPVRLEFEKVYFPYLLMNKKRYAGLYWTKPDTWDKMDAKGIETVRRDNCGLVRQVVDTVLRKILVERSEQDAIRYTKQVISDLLQNKLDISLLVITKALGKSAESTGYAAKQAHVELAERMRKRDPGSAPAVGDRVPYVIVQAAKGAPAYEKSEDPIYVLDNNIPIDTNYYLQNQLKKPLLRIFSPIIDNPESLLQGDHTRTIKKATPAVGRGIMSFAVRKLTCIAPGCNVPLKGEEKALCSRCKPKEAEIYRWKLSQVNMHEDRFSRLWTQCQRCQGSLHQDVLCTARDCPIFYMRKKVQKDLKEVTDQIARFEFAW